MNLATQPRRIELICVTDGSRRNFLDDGCDVDPNTGVVRQSRQRRCILLQAKDALIQKGPHKGAKVFYVEKPIEPAFKGDSLAQFQVLDAKAKAMMAELVAERTRFLDGSKVQAENEAALAVKAIKRSNTAAAQGAGKAEADGGKADG